LTFGYSGARVTESKKIKNGGLDQYGTEPLEQQQFGTSGVKGVKHRCEIVKRFYYLLF